MLKVGDKVPAFSLEDSAGATRRLSDFKGKTVIIYFYPKDDTPGCTKEACGFRDSHGSFASKDAVVIGISPDKPASHATFAKKYGLPFILLADPERKAIDAFGAWGEKKMYGRTFDGVIRSTFIIGPDGRISHVFPKVRPEGHAEAVLVALTA